MLPQTHKAQRCTIQLGNISLEVAMLPNGDYVFSQSEVTKVVDKSEVYIRRFLQSKWVKALPTLHSKFDTLPLEGSKKPIAPVSPELAALYWHKCAAEGNKKAQALVVTLVKYSVYELADQAFGIKRHAQERASLLAEDLSDAGVARIEAASQSLAQQQPLLEQPETLTERELKLKIQLAELDLERERLQQRRDRNLYPAKEIANIGVPPWQVTSWAQRTLGWSDANTTNQLLRQLGYGLRSKHWFTIKIIGDLWVMPHPSFNSLVEVIEKLKSGQS